MSPPASPAHERDGAGKPRRRAPLVPAEPAHLGPGLNLTIEFLAAIITWGGLGWLVDRWLGTSPWVTIAGIVLGNACGIYLVWLHSRSPEEVERARQRDLERSGSRRRT